MKPVLHVSAHRSAARARLHRRLLIAAVALLATMPRAASAAEAAPASSAQCRPERETPDLFSIGLEELLNTKVITASKSAEQEADAAGVISVVSADEIRRFGGTTLKDLLTRVPGLSGTTSYFTDRSLVASRGDQTKIDGGHLLVLINGRPTREVLEGGVTSDVFEAFPVDAIDHVEVIKGPGAVLYGSNAFSAVINVLTKDAERSAFAARAAGGGSSAYTAAATATIACGDLKVVASGQFHRKADWATVYRVPATVVADPLGPRFGLAADQAITIREQGPGGFVDLRYKRLTVMTAATAYENASFVRGAISENDFGRTFADVGFALVRKPLWDSGVNVTFTRTTLDVPGYPTIARRSHELIAEWTNTVRRGPTQLTFGALASRMQGTETYNGVTPGIAISDGHRNGAGVFAQVSQQAGRFVTLIGGLQANKIGVIDLDLVPRAAIVLHLSQDLHVKALYSQAFRAPSLNEIGLNHPGLAGTPSLRPEKVGTFDLAVRYQRARIQTTVSGFRSRQTDSITVDTTGTRWQYVNLGTATFTGGEVSTKYYVRPNLFVIASTSYQRSNEPAITPVGNLGAKGGVSVETRNGILASVFDTYESAPKGYAGNVNPRVQAYHLVASRLRVDLARVAGRSAGRLAFVVNADNLTNREVWLPDWGGNTGDSVPAFRGRSVMIGVEVN